MLRGLCLRGGYVGVEAKLVSSEETGVRRGVELRRLAFEKASITLLAASWMGSISGSEGLVSKRSMGAIWGEFV